MKEKLYIFDTTLRDGAQTYGVDFNVDEKKILSSKLDELGVDYIEGGWPGANACGVLISSYNEFNTSFDTFADLGFFVFKSEIKLYHLSNIFFDSFKFSSVQFNGWR